MSELPLYQRDPEAWQAHLREGNRTQARKRVGADVLLRDSSGRILLVDPNYKPDWDLPGGMAEANESPADAAKRELLEELGLDIPLGRLLVVDWVPPHDPWDDSLMFIFDGGMLTEEQIKALSPRDDELQDMRFVEPDEIDALLRPRMWRRLRQALGAFERGTEAFLHDGEPHLP